MKIQFRLVYFTVMAIWDEKKVVLSTFLKFFHLIFINTIRQIFVFELILFANFELIIGKNGSNTTEFFS